MSFLEWLTNFYSPDNPEFANRAIMTVYILALLVVPILEIRSTGGVNKLAKQNGWEFHLLGDESWENVIGSFPFDRGYSDTFVRGTTSFSVDNYQITLFDYIITPPGGTTKWELQCLFLKTESLEVPILAHCHYKTLAKFLIRHNHKTLAKLFQISEKTYFSPVPKYGTDWMIPGYPEFNDSFRIVSLSESLVSSVINNEVMDIMLKWKPDILTWEKGYLFYAGIGIWQAKEIEPIVSYMVDIAKLLPKSN